ncbi:unnamed protein product [Trichogramma brassicae]|uniref:Uncharacterized protein n=1 Tax=Trichogramma brassicae TaxID=86971 RepID=A0A6H5IWL1_9HYME|nr:unnamed protein product [Trichogramma brassicae]
MPYDENHFYRVQGFHKFFGSAYGSDVSARRIVSELKLEESYFPILHWKGPLPNLLTSLRREEIDRILSAAIYCLKEFDLSNNPGELIVTFVVCCGYKDVPELDESGRSVLRRATPLHLTRHTPCYVNDRTASVVRDLFQIYNDVNYIDNDGYSHFHVACMCGLDDVVERFLELGQDPNCLVSETDDSPLHLALGGPHRSVRERVIESLLRRSANPNLPNESGETPLHVISRPLIENIPDIFLKIVDELNMPLQLEARDRLGKTPLHHAAGSRRRKVIEWLLRRGADPNATDAEGSTPLHYICKDYYGDHKSLEMFFEINDELNRSVQLDVRDNEGRTPLELAVANLKPFLVRILLHRGADVSSFVFPAENCFNFYRNIFSGWILKMLRAFEIMACVENLENRGYELDRDDAFTIMKLFSKYELFEKSVDAEKHLYNDKEFARRAKNIMITTGRSERENEAESSRRQSLYDLIQLPPTEVKNLITYNEHFWLEIQYQLPIELEAACAMHLCEKISRKFFQRWTLYPYWEIIHHRVPILCSLNHLNPVDLSIMTHRQCVIELPDSPYIDAFECSIYSAEMPPSKTILVQNNIALPEMGERVGMQELLRSYSPLGPSDHRHPRVALEIGHQILNQIVASTWYRCQVPRPHAALSHATIY